MATQTMPSCWDVMMVGEEERALLLMGAHTVLPQADRWTDQLGHFPEDCGGLFF